MAETRNFNLSNFLLDVGGKHVGQVYKVDPAKLQLDIAETKVGHDNLSMKSTANMKHSEWSADVGINMGKAMGDWIMSSFNKAHQYMDGALITANANFEAVRRIEWLQALITSVSFPKCDASSKDMGKVTVKWDAEQVRWAKGGGEKIDAAYGQKLKSWAVSNFRFELGSLPTKRVVSVDAIELKQKITQDVTGELKEAIKIPGSMEHPDIKLTISRVDEDAWAAWAKGWAIDGLSLQEHDLAGRLVYLAPDMKTELGELQFQRVGLKEFSFAAHERGEKPATFNVTLYCEQIVPKLALVDG